MVGLTPRIRRILLESGYVEVITENDTIRFTDEFKVYVLQKSAEGIPRNEIFKVLGVDIFTRNYINSCISAWRRAAKDRALERPQINKGPKKRLEDMTMEELKAENALQKQEIEYLKKLRGLTK